MVSGQQQESGPYGEESSAWMSDGLRLRVVVHQEREAQEVVIIIDGIDDDVQCGIILHSEARFLCQFLTPLVYRHSA